MANNGGVSCGRKVSVHACNILNELRKTGKLCDAVLKVDDCSFPVHRAILSASSPYFRALFTNGMCETDQKEIYIPGVTSDMMAIIIEYAYTRECTVNSANVERLLPAADQFHVMGLVKSCCDFLRGSLDADNCIGIRSFAKHFFCHSLDQAAFQFALNNFQKVATRSNEILNLKAEDFMEILKSDGLNAKNEELVFDCIMRWVDHDRDNRRRHLVDLLKCIRLGLLSTQYFVETVKSHPYIRDNDHCRPLIIDTLKFLYDLDMEDSREVDLTNPLARPRIPHEIIFVIGGWSGGSPTNVMETYDTRADRWTSVAAPDKGPRAYHGCATVDGLIYVIGGFDGMDYFNSVRCFNPVSKTWSEVAPMNSRRCYVSVTVLDGVVYAMGGFDGHVRQNTAERYTPSKNQWSMIAPMTQQRSDASASVVNGKVYVAGGFNGQECLSSCESYDPSTNQWTTLQPMRNRRSGIGLTSHDGFLYAVGGFNGITRMNSGEKYNPTTNTWSAIAEMYSPRSNFAAEVIDDMVFVIGGFNGVTTIYNVECYDPKTDEWFDCTDMNIYRSALSACVVKGLTNIKDYIHPSRQREDKRRKTSNNAQ